MMIRIANPVSVRLKKFLDSERKRTGVYVPAVSYVNSLVSATLDKEEQKMDAQIAAHDKERPM